MTNTALKYYQCATYHLETVRNAYKSLMKEIILPKSDSLSVMDIGCGSGRIFYEVLLPLLPKNVNEVIGTDIDTDMIKFCRSMNTDPRVSFEKLDIADVNIPKNLESRFDLLFSSYCFSYVRNWRQGFTNCSRLLKDNGTMLLLSQFKTNAMYSTYKKMAHIDRWKSFMSDYANYEPILSGEDPDTELKQMLEGTGMKLISHKFHHEFLYEMRKKEVLGAYLALENKQLSIPYNEREAYMKDFLRIFSEETDMDFVDEKSYDDIIKFNFPSVFIHARKLDQ